MKLLIFAAVASISFCFVLPQEQQYVCLPCGYDCDTEIHDGPGTCHACGMVLIEKSRIKFSDITFEQLCERLNANPKAILLDVRTPAEFSGTSTEVTSFGHFKNAININVEELESRVGELSKYKNQEVLVYCSHSHRSPRASFFLSTNGFSNVKNMSGGVSTLTTANASECMDNLFVPHAH